jgi:hypothetical protein
MMPSSRSGVLWARKHERVIEGEEDSSDDRMSEGSKQPRRSIELEGQLNWKVNWIGGSTELGQSSQSKRWIEVAVRWTGPSIELGG